VPVEHACRLQRLVENLFSFLFNLNSSNGPPLEFRGACQTRLRRAANGGEFILIFISFYDFPVELI
jgi:hypothetical protein